MIHLINSLNVLGIKFLESAGYTRKNMIPVLNAYLTTMFRVHFVRRVVHGGLWHGSGTEKNCG